jgi:hypothetical protein
MMINGVVYGELDKKKMLKVIGGLKWVMR